MGSIVCIEWPEWPRSWNGIEMSPVYDVTGIKLSRCRLGRVACQTWQLSKVWMLNEREKRKKFVFLALSLIRQPLRAISQTRSYVESYRRRHIYSSESAFQPPRICHQRLSRVSNFLRTSPSHSPRPVRKNHEGRVCQMIMVLPSGSCTLADFIVGYWF